MMNHLKLVSRLARGVLNLDAVVCRVDMLAVCVFDVSLEVSNLPINCESGLHRGGDV